MLRTRRLYILGAQSDAVDDRKCLPVGKAAAHPIFQLRPQIVEAVLLGGAQRYEPESLGNRRCNHVVHAFKARVLHRGADIGIDDCRMWQSRSLSFSMQHLW